MDLQPGRNDQPVWVNIRDYGAAGDGVRSDLLETLLPVARWLRMLQMKRLEIS
jgi:hypothetical protein